jgi:hypothetical protein
MNRAIGEEIATKNILYILWTNTFPVFLVGNNLIFREILKENVGLSLIQSGILNRDNRVLINHGSSKV